MIPVWLAHRPPLADYPNHLARNYVLEHIGDAGSTFPRWYRADWGPYPYLSMDAILQFLLRMMTLDAAGKTLLSLGVLLLPVAIWTWLRQAAPECEWLVCLTPVLCFNLFYRQGFLNYQLGLSVAFFLFALWWKEGSSTNSFYRTLGMVMLASLLYFTHLIAFLITIIVVITDALLSRSSRHVISAFALGIPGSALYVISRWKLVHGAERLGWHCFAQKVSSLPLFFFYQSSVWSKGVTVAIAACLLSGIIIPLSRPNRRLLTIAATLFGLYLILPFTVSETNQIDIRVLPAVGVFFIVSIAPSISIPRTKVLICIALLWSVVSVVDAASQSLRFVKAERGFDAAIALLPSGSRVLPILGTRRELNDLDPGVSWYSHYVDYAVTRGAFVPTLFDFPGQTGLRVKPSYIATDWNYADWHRVRLEYDFVFLYSAPTLENRLGLVGEPIYDANGLVLYRLRK